MKKAKKKEKGSEEAVKGKSKKRDLTNSKAKKTQGGNTWGVGTVFTNLPPD